jgi:predicted GNAT superfamily acetyltransferase
MRCVPSGSRLNAAGTLDYNGYRQAMRGLEKTAVSKGKTFLLRVETSSDARDYQKYEELRNEVWGYPDDHFSATRNMMCENFLHEGSSLFIGAFPSGRDSMAGFCYGYVGLRDKERGFRDPRNLRFYSQFTAVRQEFRRFGLGVLLKEFQRETVLGLLGVGETICTYDPLTGVNALRNVHRFGMEVLEYRVATYGEYGGLLNRFDIPTDRFLMSWDLRRSSRTGEGDFERLASGAPDAILADTISVKGKNSVLDLEVVRRTDPDIRGDRILVRIPSDFYRMLQETDVDNRTVRSIPVDWRLRTRAVFQSLFDRGYKVRDFGRTPGAFPRSAYLLEKER